MSKQKLTFIAISIVCLSLICMLALWFASREPTFEGKKLSQWLLATSPNVYDDFNRSREAANVMGSSEALFFAKILRWKETPLKKRYAAVHTKLPSPVQAFLPPLRDHRMLRFYATRMLLLMETNAIPALPELIDVAAEDDGSRHNAIIAIRNLAPQTTLASNAVEAIISATKAKDLHLRKTAYSALSAFTNHAGRIVPVLIQGLHGGNNAPECIAALQAFGRAAKAPLIDAAKKESGYIRPATVALEKIDPDAAAKLEEQRLKH